MPRFPDIPPMTQPSTLSVIAFCAIVIFVVVCYALGAYAASSPNILPEVDEPKTNAATKNRFFRKTVFGLAVWLLIGAILPLSGLLRLNFLPPPGFIFAITCFGIGITLAVSSFGRRLATLPIHWLIGFHAFRLPLEMVLHHWYETETIPIQMTYEGYNFDIATGVLAIIVGLWAKFGTVPKSVVWGFNLVGFALLMTVVAIAITSIPSPFKQFEGDPMLLPFYFPFSYIVSIAVTGALLAHLILFRKLLAENA